MKKIVCLFLTSLICCGYTSREAIFRMHSPGWSDKKINVTLPVVGVIGKIEHISPMKCFNLEKPVCFRKSFVSNGANFEKEP